MRLTALAKSPPKRMVAQGVPLPAPVGGWDAISPLANMPVDRAVQLDNWICRPGWIEPRKGYVAYSTGVGTNTTPVETVMAYNGLTGNSALFAAAGASLYNCTGGGAASPVGGVTLSNARLQYIMMGSAAGASFLVAVNGADTPIAYDGTSWSQLSINIGNAYGSITWSVNMVQGETIDLNGTIVTFVTGSPSGNQVQIGANLAATLTNLVTFLNASADTNIDQCTYTQTLGNTLNITYKTSGIQGNTFTIAAGYATGSITFSVNPSNGDTITLEGQSIQFVTSGAGTNQVNIGATLAQTLTALLAVVTNSSNGSLNSFTYALNAGKTALLLTAASRGILGNSLAIAASAATVSGATLTGGSTAAASGSTLTGGSQSYGITPQNFIGVAQYAGLLWFVPINSTNAVYLQTVEGIQGAASVFPLGQEFQYGGYLNAIGTWTVDTRQSVDEYIAFISSRGEVLVYQGTSPQTATTFQLVGRYKIGTPIGRRCFLRISGDLQIITVDGIVGMSEMLSTDRAAANRVSLTSIIMNQVSLAARLYKGHFGWQIIEYALGTLAIVNIPIAENAQQMQFVMNTITGAWSRWIGLNPQGAPNASYGINANHWEVDANDNIYFGGNNGTVYQWNIGEGDASQPITCVLQQAYNSFGNAAQFKRYSMLQPLITTTGTPIPSIGISTDFNETTTLSTPQPVSSSQSLWGSVQWGNFNWSDAPVTTNNWGASAGMGHYVSPMLLLTTYPDVNDPTFSSVTQLNGWNILAESGAFV
jgi:hypothetical protein